MQPAHLARRARCIHNISPVCLRAKKCDTCLSSASWLMQWIRLRAVRTWMSLSRSPLQSVVLLSYNYEYYYYYGVETATWLRIENAYRVISNGMIYIHAIWIGIVFGERYIMMERRNDCCSAGRRRPRWDILIVHAKLDSLCMPQIFSHAFGVYLRNVARSFLV